MPLRIIAALVGLLFIFNALQWVVMPEAAARGLGMPLLDGMGRSSQLGDITALFTTIGVASLLGAYLSNSTWLRAGALMLGSAALMRIVAWAFHEAVFATGFIAIEVVLGGLLFFLAWRFDTQAGDDSS